MLVSLFHNLSACQCICAIIFNVSIYSTGVLLWLALQEPTVHELHQGFGRSHFLATEALAAGESGQTIADEFDVSRESNVWCHILVK